MYIKCVVHIYQSGIMVHISKKCVVYIQYQSGIMVLIKSVVYIQYQSGIMFHIKSVVYMKYQSSWFIQKF